MIMNLFNFYNNETKLIVSKEKSDKFQTKQFKVVKL